MKQMMRLFLLLGFLLSHQVDAKPLKPFIGASRLAIEKAHQGQPLILAFWSLDCNYCLDELSILGEFVKQHPKVHLVLVNTDGLSTTKEVVNTLTKIRLPVAYEAWQFSEPDEERLRYTIDKSWYGELPRTYYYDSSHLVKAVSGSPDLIWLKSWASKL